MNNLPKVATQLLPRVGFEPVDRKSNALPVAVAVAPSRHLKRVVHRM